MVMVKLRAMLGFWHWEWCKLGTADTGNGHGHQTNALWCYCTEFRTLQGVT